LTKALDEIITTIIQHEHFDAHVVVVSRYYVQLNGVSFNVYLVLGRAVTLSFSTAVVESYKIQKYSMYSKYLVGLLQRGE
jgi:hypothetical protein